MSSRKLLLVAAVLALGVPFAPAFAHDDVDSAAIRHARDHAEHGREHRNLAAAHRAAHDDGFDSRAEHRTYHRELRADHNEFHVDHPNTRHGHDH